MPFRLRDSAKFKWHTGPDDKPLAPVVRIGMTFYISVCPICSCLHELTGQRFEATGEQIVTRPRCLLVEFATTGGLGSSAWRAVYENWLKAHPQAASVSDVQAVYLGSVATVSTTAQAVKALAKYALPEQEAKAA